MCRSDLEMAARRLLVALNVEESTVTGLELPVNQEIRIVKYSPPELAIDTHGKENSVIPIPIANSTALGSRQQLRLLIPAAPSPTADSAQVDSFRVQ